MCGYTMKKEHFDNYVSPLELSSVKGPSKKCDPLSTVPDNLFSVLDNLLFILSTILFLKIESTTKVVKESTSSVTYVVEFIVL